MKIMVKSTPKQLFVASENRSEYKSPCYQTCTQSSMNNKEYNSIRLIICYLSMYLDLVCKWLRQQLVLQWKHSALYIWFTYSINKYAYVVLRAKYQKIKKRKESDHLTTIFWQIELCWLGPFSGFEFLLQILSLPSSGIDTKQNPKLNPNNNVKKVGNKIV